MTRLSVRPQFLTNYPRVGNMSGIGSAGGPFVVAGVVQTELCRQQAWYDIIMIDGMRADQGLTPGTNLQALRLIRDFNPRANMMMYFDSGRFFNCCSGFWDVTCSFGGTCSGVCPPAGCSQNTIQWAQNVAVTTASNSLVFRQGSPNVAYTANGNIGPVIVDYGKVNSNIDVTMAQVAMNWYQASGVFNSIWCDELCTDITWTENNGSERIDYAASGYGSLAAWAAARVTAVTNHLNWFKLNKGIPTIGNCGPQCPSGCVGILNGWMGENFPDTNPGNWNDWEPILDAVDTRYAAPRTFFITRNSFGKDFLTGVEAGFPIQQWQRFGLGNASLYDNVIFLMANGALDGVRGFRADYWADEFSVDREGFATLDDSHKGWLGQPTTAKYSVGSLRARDYQNGRVVVNPTFAPISYTAPGYFKIKGRSSANNGQTPTSVPAWDALLLQRRRRQ